MALGPLCHDPKANRNTSGSMSGRLNVAVDADLQKLAGLDQLTFHAQDIWLRCTMYRREEEGRLRRSATAQHIPQCQPSDLDAVCPRGPSKRVVRLRARNDSTPREFVL